MIHYLANVFVFGFLFHFYFEARPKTSPFDTMIIAILSLTVFEAVFLWFYAEDPMHFLNYVDWIFPAFLIATTVYAVGKRGW